MTKRLLSSFLVLLIVIGILPAIEAKAAVENTLYSSEKALAYAKNHWDDGKGLCAEFVSDCLSAGGLSQVYNPRVVNLYNALLDNKCGKAYKLKITDGSISESQNKGKIKAGDPIFFYCNCCGEFTHVSLCNGFNSDGYAVDYSHNNAHNGNKRTYTYYHCGSKNWTMYSISMYNEESLFGKKTSIDAPEIENVMNVKDGVYLKWNKISNATYYRVYRRTADSNWSYLGNTKSLCYTDKTAKENVEYTYTVRACKSGVFSQYYAGKTAVYLTMPTFKSISNVKNSIKITWNGSSFADGYYIYRQVNNGKWSKYTTIKSADILSYTDKKVSNGNTYNYRVRAFKDDIVSSYDAKGIGVQCIVAPKLTSITNVNEGIRVNWNTVTGADSYRVYRKAQGEKSWKYLGTTSSDSYVDTNVQGAVNYTYTVRSAKGKTFGSYDSKGISVKCIETPVITGAEYTEDGVNLTWQEVDGATGYYVYHKAEDATKWSRIAVVKAETSFEDEIPVEDSTYLYTVRAYNGKTKSSFYRDGLKCVCDESLGVQSILTDEQKAEVKTSVVSTIFDMATSIFSGITLSVDLFE